jgi:hypothetical protein
MGFHPQSADGEGDQPVACAIDYDKPAAGELEVHAFIAEAQLVKATAKPGNNGGGAENVSDVRYASLKRYPAKRFHP